MNATELLLRTQQLLKFRLAFALAGLLMVLAIRIFSGTEFQFQLIANIIVCVLIYSSAVFLWIKYLAVSRKIIAVPVLIGDDSQSSLSGFDQAKLKWIHAALLGLDIIVLTALVHATRGIESDLYILYLLPILFSSYIFGRKGIYTTSFFVSLSYVGLLLTENYQSLDLLIGQSQGPVTGLAAAYLNTLWQRILLRSTILTSVSFIWGGFCGYMAGLAQLGSSQLRQQLTDNERLVTELENQARREEMFNASLMEKNQHLDQVNLELKQMQSQLIHHEKMASLGRLVAGVAHELNNPINFVHGNLPYLKTYFQELKNLIAVCDFFPEEDKKVLSELKEKLKYDFLITDLDNILADMDDGVKRIRQIIKNLRSFGRLDEAEMQEASINEGIISTLKILAQYYGQDKIPLELDLVDLPPVMCNPGQLNQVWMNLLSNAAQAVEKMESPVVKVKSQLQNDQILVSIEDNGAGIDLQSANKIFEPFFTTKPVGQGTGLGLSICHSIIERHQGKIWFEPGLSSGTIFKVSIPLLAELQVNDNNEV